MEDGAQVALLDNTRMKITMWRLNARTVQVQYMSHVERDTELSGDSDGLDVNSKRKICLP